MGVLRYGGSGRGVELTNENYQIPRFRMLGKKLVDPSHASMSQRKFKFSLVNLIVYVSHIVKDESVRMYKNSAVLSLTFCPDIAYRLFWNHEMSARVWIPTTRGVKV
jgi:hypothetical protein